MKKTLLIIAVMTAFSSCASATKIVQSFANTANPAVLIDGDISTSAMIKLNPNNEFFDIIVGLDEDANPEDVTLLLKEKTETVTMAFSSDIVNWTETAVMAAWFDAEGGRQKVVLSPLDHLTGKYIRLRMKKAGAAEIEAFEVSATYASKQPNKVSDINAKILGDHSVEITYKTEFPGKTHVKYGAEDPVFDRVYIARESVTEHRVVLKDLLAGTIYYFQIQAVEDEEKAPVNSFTTSGNMLPKIKKVYVDEPGWDTARIHLAANKPVKWKVLWGRLQKALPKDIEKSGAENLTLDAPAKETTLDITNLTPRKAYYFQVFVEDDKGETAKSDILGLQAAEKNIAIGAVATGTFVEEKTDDKYIQKSANPIGRVTDGDENYHTGFAKSGKPAAAPQWVQIDMGSSKKIDDIVIVWSDLAVPEDYTVTTSNDNLSKNIVLEVTKGKYPDDVKVRETRSRRGDPLREIRLKANADIRYIQIDIPKGTKIISRFDWDYAILAEIKAIEPEME